MRRKWTIQSIEKLVDGYHNYDGPKLEYIKKTGLATSQFYKLKKRLSSNLSEPAKDRNNKGCQSVVQLVSQHKAVSGIEINFPSGCVLKCSEGTDLKQLAGIINLLQRTQ